jgi:L-threonylcarbamoyladenylate synthase
VEHLIVGADPRDAIARAAELVLAGGVVAYPTDTLYGLAVDPRNVQAVDRLFAIKGRSGGQPIPLIATDLAQAAGQAGELNELARRLASAFWPGPLTLVVPAHPGIAAGVHAGTGRVAVRVPNHDVARALAARCGTPVTSTSANLSGHPASNLVDAVREALADRIDAILDAGPTPGGLPSTIVDVTGAAPSLVRAGVVPWDRVLESS